MNCKSGKRYWRVSGVLKSRCANVGVFFKEKKKCVAAAPTLHTQEERKDWNTLPAQQGWDFLWVPIHTTRQGGLFCSLHACVEWLLVYDQIWAFAHPRTVD
jgi:hypothetical protein